MAIVVEKDFVWKFIDEATGGIKQAQDSINELLSVLRSSGSVMQESTDGMANFGEKAQSMSEQINSAMKESKSSINKVKESIDGLPNEKKVDVQAEAKEFIEKIKDSKDILSKIPKSVRTELNALAKEQGISNFDEKLKQIPKERQTELVAKIANNEAIDFKKELELIPKKHETQMTGKGNSAPINQFKNDIDKIPTQHNTVLDADPKGEPKIKGFVDTLKGTAIGMGVYNAAMKVGTAVSNQFAGAISRYDTLNNYPKILESMGISANDASASMKTLKQGVDGLPTSLDEVAKTAQRLIPMSKNADDASKSALALNDAFLASGASSEDASRGLEQYTQMLSSGKVDMQSWRTLEETMPASLRKVSQSFGIAGGSVQELYQQLKSGKISMQELNQHFQQLDQGVNGFHQTALNATGGIGTAFRNMGNRVKAAIADAMGGFDKFVQKTTGKTIAGNINDLSSHFSGFGKSVSDGFSKAGEALKPFSSALGVVSAAVAVLVNNAKLQFSGFASAFKANFIAPSKDAKGAIDKVKTALSNFGKAIAPVMSQIGSLMGILSANAFRLVGDAIKAVISSFTSLGNAIGKTDLQSFHKTLTNIGIGFNQAVVAIEPFVISLGKIIGIMANGAFRAFSAILRDISNAVSGFASQFAKLDASNNTAKKIGNSLNGIAKNKNKIEAVGKAIAGLVAALVSAKGAVIVFNKLKNGLGVFTTLIRATKSIKSFEGALTLMKFGLNNAFKALGGWPGLITLVVTGFIELYKHSSKFREACRTVVEATKSAFGTIGKIIHGITSTIGKVANGWNHFCGKMADYTVKLANNIGKGFNSMSKTISKWGSDIGKITQKAMNGVKHSISSGLSAISHFWNSTWNGISNFFQSIWNGIVHFVKWYIQMCSNAIRTEMNTISKVWHTIWNAIKEFVMTIWNGIKSAVSSAINFVHDVISNTLKAIQSVWNSIWNAISSFFSGIWNGLKNMASASINWIHDTISSVLDKISDAWHSMWSGLSSFFGGIWKDIKQFAQDGINGVLHVINAGIDGIDAVWKFFTGHETSIHHLKPVHFSQGGIVDRHLSMVNDGVGSDWKELIETPSGELMMSNERNAVLPLEPGTRVYNGEETRSIMNALGVEHYANGGVVGGIEHYADGGVVGDLINWGGHELKDFGKWIKDKWDAITKFLKHPLENTKAIISKAITKPLNAIKNSNMVQLGKGVFDKLTQPIADWFKKGLEKAKQEHDAESVGGFGKIPDVVDGQNLRDLVKKALEANGLSTADDMIARVMRQIATESGGNAHAVQPGADPDGDGSGPALGLMQTKRGTFNAYKAPGHDDIFNAYDNLLAALNYAKHRYGPSLSFLGNGHGYASGAHLTSLDYAWLADNPEHNEFVINPYAPSARPLLREAMHQTEMAQPETTTQNSSSSNSENSIGERIVALLEAILAKDSNINLESSSDKLRKHDAQLLRMTNLQRGM